jgi:hypothetical protein
VGILKKESAVLVGDHAGQTLALLAAIRRFLLVGLFSAVVDRSTGYGLVLLGLFGLAIGMSLVRATSFL